MELMVVAPEESIRHVDTFILSGEFVDLYRRWWMVATMRCLMTYLFVR